MQALESGFCCIDASTVMSVDKLLQALHAVGMNADRCTHRDKLVMELQDTACSGVRFSDFVSRVKEAYRLDFLATPTEDNQKWTQENNALRAENESLRHRLEVMQKLCLKAEDDETRMRKELQLQIETMRNLGKCLQEIRSEDQPEAERLTAKESRDDVTRVVAQLQSDDCRDVARRMLQFIETLPSMLSKLEPPSGTCSCSSSAPMKSVGTSRTGAVTRAATVNCRPPRTVNVASAVGQSPPKYVRGQRKGHSERHALLKNLTEDAKKLVATAKPILEVRAVAEDSHERSYVNCAGPFASRNVAEAIGRLHRNVPSTAVVTIMSRV